MDTTIATALITAGSSVLVAITALVLNYHGFTSINSRIGALETSMNSRFASVDSRFVSIDNRLTRIEDDMKHFNKALASIESDVARLKDKAGLT